MEGQHLLCGKVICHLCWVEVAIGCARNSRRLAEKWAASVPCDRIQLPLPPMRRAATAVGCYPPLLLPEMRSNRGTSSRRGWVCRQQLLMPIPCFGQKGKKCHTMRCSRLIAQLSRKAFQRYSCLHVVVL